MYTAWLYFEDQFRDVFFPEHDTWTGQIVLSQLETGWGQDVTFPVRMLEGRLYLTLPVSFNWEDTHARQEREIPLETMFKLLSERHDRPVRIIFKKLDRQQLVFAKYLTAGRNIRIGRDEQSDICDPQSIMSASHGFISFRDGGAQYADQSSNGTYLNGRMLHNTAVQLRFGDVLTFPTGLKLVMLGRVIALNHLGSLAHVRLQKAAAKPVPALGEEKPLLPSLLVEYHRAPRMMIRTEEETVEIEPPLAKNNQPSPPLWQQIGPSATMVLPMLMSVIVMNGGRSLTGLVMIGTSSALAVMWGLINRNYRGKQEVANEQARVALYQKYIDEMEQQLRGLNEREYRRLVETFPNVGQCAALPADLQSHSLWNRMPTHDDFLELRLGTGEVKLPSQIEFQPQKLSIIDDPLRDEPERLKRIYSSVTDAPYTVKLRGESVIGILGDSEAVLFAQGLLMQTAALHSYHDVRIVVLTEEASASQWEWVRWLPHIFTNEDREMRMLASRPAAVHDVMTHLDDVLTMRYNPEESDSQGSDEEQDPKNLPLPHYLIFCTNDRLLEDEPVMRKLLTRKLGTTLVMIAPSMEMLPKECHIIINLSSKPGFLHTSEGDTQKVDFEYPNRNLLRSFAQQIAPIRVHDAVESAAIPTLVSFLDIYNARRVEDLDVWRMWSENRTWEGLRSVIGYTQGSRPFVLDISEKYHGPHGLIAGTTGSGKSVMLQTYILSLALNYSPQQVQFILIDYKGGGMADAFRNLPHVVGIIDNLQGEQIISRALASLNGEIHRRETLFKAMKVGDITEYSKQFADDPEAVKLPHLIIITDEFAELKSDQPEFMKELVSASRVGRSLGVHLILATQKPSASVSDEIWANSRFHLCLRVQTVADSRDMLKRPDAAYIKGTGRCFIQIGNDESFDQVQTSYSGLPYDPNVPRPEEMPHLLDDAGRPVKAPKRGAKGKEETKITQMDAVLKHIGRIAHEHHMDHSRQMWMPEIPGKIAFGDLQLFNDNRMRDGVWQNRPAGVQFLLGLADDTAHQRYLPYIVNLTEIRNLLIVGLAGTGKTTAVQSMVYSLCNQYDPAHLNIYILSLTSQTLGKLQAFPHVGDVVFENDVVETRRFFDMMIKEEERRSELFAQAATDSFIEYNRAREAAGQPPVPAIVIFIDRFEQLRAMFDSDETTTARIQALIREGSGRGIHFITTALAKSEVPYKLHAFFSGIALQLNDRADYSDVIGKRVPYEMPPIARRAGRSLAAIGDTLYEVQIALAGKTAEPATEGFAGFDDLSPYIIELPMEPSADLGDSERADLVGAFAGKLSAAWTGALPPRIPRIPSEATWELFEKEPDTVEMQKTPMTLPMGYDMNSGLPTGIDLEENYTMFITGPKRSGKTNMLKYLARAMQARGAEVHILADSDWMSFARETGIPLHSTREEIAKFLHEFQENVLAKERGPLKRAAKQEGTRAALHNLQASLTPYTLIIDRGERFNTDYNDADSAADLKFCRDFLSQLFTKGDHYNFQIFVASPFSARTYFNQEPLRSIALQGRGVSMGGKVNDCNVLGIADVLRHGAAAAALPIGHGWMITNGALKRIVVPLSESEDER